MAINRNKIFALIGVIGSGKDHYSQRLVEKYDANIYDFSDGVREFIFDIVGENPHSPQDYIDFKYNGIDIDFGSFMHNTTGRKLMENMATKLRAVDPYFWAKICVKNAEKAVPNHIVFNAVRYLEEAEMIIDFSQRYIYDLDFVFCNFKSKRYEIRNHESEFLAQKVLRSGAIHGSIINFAIEQLIYEKQFT